MNIPSTDPLTVPCPICNAPVGSPCTDLYGHPRAIPHVERNQMAQDDKNSAEEGGDDSYRVVRTFMDAANCQVLNA
jgi:hypothetical protein